MNQLDIGRSFTFTFEDQEWIVKILIGGLLSLFSFLLIPIPILTGYYLDVIETTREGNDLPLPKWDNFGRYFSRGLMVSIGALVYMLPTLLLACCFIFVGFADESGEGGLAATLALCLTCLITLYSLGIWVVLPAAVVRYLETGTLAGMFEFGKIWNLIQRNPGQYFTVILLALGASLAAGIVASVTCGLISPWTSFWATVVGAHLLGQFWRNAGGDVPVVDDDPPLAPETV